MQWPYTASGEVTMRFMSEVGVCECSATTRRRVATPDFPGTGERHCYRKMRLARPSVVKPYPRTASRSGDTIVENELGLMQLHDARHNT